MSRAWLEIVADAAEGVPEERLVEIASNGISIGDRHVATPVVLMPSMVARPWVVLAEAADNGTQLTNDSIEAYRVWMLP